VHGSADTVASHSGKHVQSLLIAAWKRAYAHGNLQNTVTSPAPGWRAVYATVHSLGSKVRAARAAHNQAWRQKDADG
jgi:hypothetical protein